MAVLNKKEDKTVNDFVPILQPAPQVEYVPKPAISASVEAYKKPPLT